MLDSTKVILLHGFSNQDVTQILNAYKQIKNMPPAIFAATTETSLEWKVKELIKELEKEHEEFKKMKEAQK